MRTVSETFGPPAAPAKRGRSVADK